MTSYIKRMVVLYINMNTQKGKQSHMKSSTLTIVTKYIEKSKLWFYILLNSLGHTVTGTLHTEVTDYDKSPNLLTQTGH